MKRNLTSLFYFLFLINFSFSQVGEIQWQNDIGGSSGDELHSIKHTLDGGAILGGFSWSGISGDKTENYIGANDYWVVKLNSLGNIVWQNTIGGNSSDYLNCIEQTIDGGYILGGYSNSGLSGDKTEASLAGSNDYWVVKLNSSGNIQWQNTIGGTGNDFLYDIKQTSDGGYILAGESDSPISFDKTEASIGGADYWVIKLSSTGEIQWQNTIGGSSYDALFCVQQTTDGGYILGGMSGSGISGDKTEITLGIYDFWVLKLDNTGNIIWQNSIGGNGNDQLISLEQTNDGGYILGGWTDSGISGDKTEPNLGLYDYWVVKLNSSGNIQWQNTIGGNTYDFFRSIQQTLDGGYILGGYSNSGISGDKSEASIGFYDYWVIKLDDAGTILWENTIGGSSDDVLYSIDQALDGGYLLGGYSASPISGDKTEAAVGPSYDYWIIKLSPDCTAGAPEFCNDFDDDCDGFVDNGVVETISISASGATSFCSGGNVNLTATHSGTSIQWKKNGTNIPDATSTIYSATTTGTYSAQTSSDCDTEISNEIYVHVNKKPNAFIYADGPTSFCAGGSVTLIANAGGGLSYQWYKGASPIAGATNINYVATTSGNYKCLVTKIVSGCSKQSNAIAVAVTCKKENEINSNDQFIIYPNPSSETINIALTGTTLITDYSRPTRSSGRTLLIVTDLSGKTIAQYELTSSKTEIDISNFPPGIYFVKIIIDDMQLTEKFIKQ